jgi:hypothetical protein
VVYFKLLSQHLTGDTEASDRGAGLWAGCRNLSLSNYSIVSVGYIYFPNVFIANWHPFIIMMSIYFRISYGRNNC